MAIRKPIVNGVGDKGLDETPSYYFQFRHKFKKKSHNSSKKDRLKRLEVERKKV